MDTTDEKNSDKLDDIYEDFADFDLGKTVDKLQNENKELKGHIYSQEINIKKLAEALEEMQKVNESLTNNISSLYRTAKSELERKDCTIADLRNQVDNITFRRIGGQINTNINRGLNIHIKEASFVKSEVEITNITREDYITKVDTISDKCDVPMVDDHLINRKELFTASNCEQNIENKYKESETRNHHKNNIENRHTMFQQKYNNNKESTFKNHNSQLGTSMFEEDFRKYNNKSRHQNEFNVRDLRYRIPKKRDKSYNRGDHSDYRFDRRYEENKGHCSRQNPKMDNKSHSYHDREGHRNDTYKRPEDKLQVNKRSETKKILKVVDKMENKILTKSRTSNLELLQKETLEKSKKKLEKNKEKLEANKDQRSEEMVLKQTSQPVKNFFTDHLDHILDSIQNNINEKITNSDKGEPQKIENVSQEEKSISKKKNHRRSKAKLNHLFEEELEHPKEDDNFIEILDKSALQKIDKGDKKEGKHNQNNKFEKDIGLLENYIEISSMEDDGFFDGNLRKEIEPTKKRKKEDFDCSLEENKTKKIKHSNLAEELILDADEIKTKKKRKSKEKVTKEDLNSILFGDDSISNDEQIKTKKKRKSKENCVKKDFISLLFSDDSISNNKSEKLSSLVLCNNSNEKINTKKKRKSKENKVTLNDNVVSESVNDIELGPSLKNCPITPDEAINDVIKRDGGKKTKKQPKSETFCVEPNLKVSEDKNVKILSETISNCLEVLENQAFAKQNIDKHQISSENNKNQSTNCAENNRDNLKKEKMVVEENNDKDEGQFTKKSQKSKKDDSYEKNSTFAVAQKKTGYTRCSITPIDEDIVSSKHNCLEILEKTADKHIDKDQVPSEDNKKRNKNGAENNRDNSEKEKNRSPKKDFNLEDNKDKDGKPLTKKSQRIQEDDSCEKNSTFAVAQKKTDYTPLDENIVSSKGTPVNKETTEQKSEKHKSVLHDSCEKVEAVKKIPKKRKSPRITSTTKFSPNNRKSNMSDKQNLEDTTEIETIGKKSSILRDPLKEKEDSPCDLRVKPDSKIVIVSDILLQSGTPKRQKAENKSLKEGTQNTLRIQIDFTDLENGTKESNSKSEAGIIEDVSKVDFSDISRKLNTLKSVSRKDILLERYASDESQNKLNKCREILNKNKNENLSNESNKTVTLKNLCKIEAKNLNKSGTFSEKIPKINPLKKRRVDFKLTDTEAENNKEKQIENIEQTLKLMHKMEKDNIEETKQMLGSNRPEKKEKLENKKVENTSATNERTLRRGRSRSTSDKAAINNKSDYEAAEKTKNPREIKQRISETDKNENRTDRTSEAITETNKLARKSTEDAIDGSSKIMEAIDDTSITDHKNKLKIDDTQTTTKNRKEELTSLSDRKSASEVRSNTTEQYKTNVTIQQHLDLSTNSLEREKNDKTAEKIEINISDQKPQENSLVTQKNTHQLPPCLGNIPVNSSNSHIGQLPKARKRITPTPVKDSPVCSFKNILERNNAEYKIFSKNFTMESSLNLTDEGEIPILHLEENHFNNMEDATQKTFDRSIMKLLDCMNVSNLECDISKLNDKVENSAPNESLTFENVIDKASNAVVDNVTSNNEEGKVVDINRNRTPVKKLMQTKMLTSTPRVDANVVINDTIVTNNQIVTPVKTVNTSKTSLNVTNARANGVSTSVNVTDRSVNGSLASVSEPVRFRRRCRMIAVRKM